MERTSKVRDVRIKSGMVGRIVALGEEVSEVRWPNGMDQFVGNNWLVLADSDDKQELSMVTAAAEKTKRKSATKPAAEKAAKAPKVAKVAKAKEPRAGRKSAWNDEHVITFGKIKGGDDYGKENNPLRKNSAAALRFGKITSGMTVAAYRKVAGKHIGSDLKFFTSKKYVSVGAAR